MTTISQGMRKGIWDALLRFNRSAFLSHWQETTLQNKTTLPANSKKPPSFLSKAAPFRTRYSLLNKYLSIYLPWMKDQKFYLENQTTETFKDRGKPKCLMLGREEQELQDKNVLRPRSAQAIKQFCWKENSRPACSVKQTHFKLQRKRSILSKNRVCQHCLFLWVSILFLRLFFIKSGAHWLTYKSRPTSSRDSPIFTPTR